MGVSISPASTPGPVRAGRGMVRHRRAGLFSADLGALLQIQADFDSFRVQIYDARPMSAELPAAIDPIRLADDGSSLKGELSVQAMPRLRELCRNAAAKVQVNLRFGRGAEGRVMEGTIAMRLDLTCQRCLGALEQDVVATMHVVLLQTGESRSRLPEDADFIEVAAPVSLPELVEDELLLVLPMTPRHPQGECPETAPGKGRKDRPDTGTVTSSSPFSVLADLKRKQ